MALTRALFLALAFLNLAASSFAGEAQCGDYRKIERDGFCSTTFHSCDDLRRNDPSGITSCDEKAKANVFERTGERLQKFDQECKAKGGTILSVDSKITEGPYVYDENFSPVTTCTTKYHGYEEVQCVCSGSSAQ